MFFAGVEEELMLDVGEREEYKMLSERALTEYSSRCLCPCCDFTGMTLFDYVRNYLALSYSTAQRALAVYGVFPVLSVYKVYVQLEYYHMVGILNCQLRGRGGGEVVLSEKYWTLISSFCE